MNNNSTLETALSGFDRGPEEWMSATQVKPIIFDDPGVVWLKYHGKEHDLLPNNEAPYEFVNFIFRNGGFHVHSSAKETGSLNKHSFDLTLYIRSAFLPLLLKKGNRNSKPRNRIEEKRP